MSVDDIMLFVERTGTAAERYAWGLISTDEYLSELKMAAYRAALKV